MAQYPEELYQHIPLPTKTSFRLLELLPGLESDPISCRLRCEYWDDFPTYEALSYAWGDPTIQAPVIVDGKRINVTVNLQTALSYLRYEDRHRVMWVDAICINQTDVPERGYQVLQMRKVYQRAESVHIWVGPDSKDHHARVAIASIIVISNFLCGKLGIPISDLKSVGNLYQEVMAKNRNVLPLPNEGDFSNEATWKALLWFYKHPYFTRVWAIQEANANKERVLHCGYEEVLWDRVSLVACYITMETTFSKSHNFTDAYCWWAATMSTDILQPKNWLLMLYLASNFFSLDPKDVIYSLRGIMEFRKGAELLEPDYRKSVGEVYRDSVEAALVNFETTDVLLYVHGMEAPSWVPRWDIPMLFRNPFRFGKPLPWKPAGGTHPIWSIDKQLNILSLSGFLIGSIEFVNLYSESYFGNVMTESKEGRKTLEDVWRRILETMRNGLLHVPFSADQLTAAATSFSYGVNEKSEPENNHLLLQRFVAYLRIALDEETYKIYVPVNLSEDSRKSDGHLFGKPVWDFEYPKSSFFITEDKYIGCSIAIVRPGDVVFIAHGSTFPLILRPDGKEYRIRGFAYIHGLMHAEKKDATRQVVKIR